MAEIVNLRLARKARARSLAAAEAAAQRARFGRSKADRHQAQLAAERDARMLDGAKLSDS